MLGVSSLYLILSGTIFFTINYYYTQINDVINEPSTPIYSIEPDQNFILFLFYFILLSSFIGFIIRTLYTIFIANPLSVGESNILSITAKIKDDLITCSMLFHITI